MEVKLNLKISYKKGLFTVLVGGDEVYKGSDMRSLVDFLKGLELSSDFAAELLTNALKEGLKSDPGFDGHEPEE